MAVLSVVYISVEKNIEYRHNNFLDNQSDVLIVYHYTIYDDT